MKPHRNRRKRLITQPLPAQKAILLRPSVGPVLPGRAVTDIDEEESARQVLKQLESVIGEFTTEYPLHTRSIPVPLPGEHPLIAFVRNMARSMSAKQKQLEKLHAEAVATVRAEEQFLANMSHEVRTPMNAIFGMVNLLLEMDLTPTQRDYIETIHSGSELLLNVMNDVLDLSKISAQKLVLKPRVFRIRQILDDMLWIYQPMASKKGLKLEGMIEEEIPEYLWGDDLRLKQILSNLISNAIKFTPDGKVTVRVLANEENPSRLRFVIEDSGIGISQKNRDSLFDPFTQADDSHSQSGTGLGLAICKNLVDLMQGEIEFESEPGIGTSFFFTAKIEEASPAEKAAAKINQPVEPPEPPPNAIDVISDGKAYRVLIVEDNIVNQKVARLSLEKLGCGVLIANNGEEAVKMVAANDAKFDLICMDVNMPIMSGIEATKRIRLLEGPGSEARILAITGLAFEEDRRKCLEAGMDDFITKPFSIDDLRTQLLAAESGNTGEVALPA